MAMTVVSKVVFTKVDQQGNPWTEGWFTLEFRAAYVPGGEPVDLSSDFKQILFAQATPISGALILEPRANMTDFPNTVLPAQSGRFQLDALAAGIGISVASGTILINSGLASGFQSGLAAQASLFSGTIQVNGLSGQTSPYKAEVLSGVAVSGTRLMAHVLGY